MDTTKLENKLQKPAVKSTELWMTLVGAVLSVAMVLGYVTPGESEEITGAVSQVIKAVEILLVALAPVIPVVAYVWSRTRVKDSIAKIISGKLRYNA